MTFRESWDHRCSCKTGLTIASVALERDKASAQVTGSINIRTSPTGSPDGELSWLDLTGGKSEEEVKASNLRACSRRGQRWGRAPVRSRGNYPAQMRKEKQIGLERAE